MGPQELPPEEAHPPQFFAMREMSFSMSVEPHEGHATFWAALMTSSSNNLPHAPHWYSNIGIAVPFSLLARLLFGSVPDPACLGHSGGHAEPGKNEPHDDEPDDEKQKDLDHVFQPPFRAVFRPG